MSLINRLLSMVFCYSRVQISILCNRIEYAKQHIIVHTCHRKFNSTQVCTLVIYIQDMINSPACKMQWCLSIIVSAVDVILLVIHQPFCDR